MLLPLLSDTSGSRRQTQEIIDFEMVLQNALALDYSYFGKNLFFLKTLSINTTKVSNMLSTGCERKW